MDATAILGTLVGPIYTAFNHMSKTFDVLSFALRKVSESI